MQNSAESPNDDQSSENQENRSILIALVFPTIALLFSLSAFGVALPTIRDEFGISNEVTSWLSIAFTLAFIILMPLMGRLGDEFGKSRLLQLGITISFAGTAIVWWSPSLEWVFIGRIIQGLGSAGVTPLSLAIIQQRFSPTERGRAMGQWNSMAPFTSIFAPTIGGFLIDNYGWRTIFLPAMALSLFALFIVRKQIRGRRLKPNWAYLRSFDWIGTLLLGSAIVFMVFTISSRPVTGVEPFRDWRLATAFLLLFGTFIWRERRHPAPLINLGIFRDTNFVIASLGAGCRMAMMTGISFLLPLYLTDLYGATASQIGLIASVHSVTLFVMIRVGGRLSDRISNRRLIFAGLLIQAISMAVYALLPAELNMGLVGGLSIINGFGAGLNIAALHRSALGSIADEEGGSAAGVYSMTRFAGSLIGTALLGVILQILLDGGTPVLRTYQLAYAALILIGMVGWLASIKIHDLI